MVDQPTSPPTLRHLAQQIANTAHNDGPCVVQSSVLAALLDERDAHAQQIATLTDALRKAEDIQLERGAEISRLIGQLDAAEQHVKIAREFGEQAAARYNELLREFNKTTCAFCGLEFPDGTPRHNDPRLVEHIKVCEQHPLRAAEARATTAEREREELREQLTDALNEAAALRTDP